MSNIYNHLVKLFIAVVLLSTWTSCQCDKQSAGMSLWYEQPADEWMKATPIGNGRLGAMIYGGINTETVALNEITMWSGQYDEHQEDACGKEKLAEIRQLFFDGKIAEGNHLASQYLTGKPHSFGSHLPVGDLKIIFEHDTTKIINYKRALNLQDATTTVSYEIDGIKYKREYICSNPDDVMLIRLSANKSGAIDIGLNLDMLRESDLVIDSLGLAFTGQALFSKQGPGGVHFTGRVGVTTIGGEIDETSSHYMVKDADEVLIAIDIRTDYKNPDYKAMCQKTIDNALSKDYASLKQAHIEDYKALFGRVDLFLGESDLDNLPTDVRWKQIKTGKADPGLDALFFQYGRYLLIASSRENSPLPANLQGVWNDNLACNMPWTCDYHLDINTQQNYWLSNVGNLHECNDPLFRYVNDLSIHGEKTAMKVYGSPGWTAHTVANVWGYTAPGASIWWGLFPTAGAWMTTHLWEHYTFTKDVDFLRNTAYPLLKKTAIFFQDYMVENPNNGYLMTGPSNSPENTFRYEGGEYALSMMTTCDRILVYEIYQACIQSAEILGVDADFKAALEADIKRLPPLKIGKNGEVQEWFEDYESAHINHRHASHLLSLYPYAQITPDKTPELAKAAQLVVENKLNSEGWEDVEFSRANTIAFYARLKNGAEAYKNLSLLLKELMRENLFTYSPPGVAGADWDIFIFDGNEAAPAAMADMLLQSHDGYIEFLPALPVEWNTGHFKGLCVRGGGEVDLEWKDGKVKNARLKAGVSNQYAIKVPESSQFKIKINEQLIQPDVINNIITIEMKSGDILELSGK